MSGHSKWHQIRHKKGIADAKKGAVFTKHAKMITIAARAGGGDAEMNPSLRLAIDNAKAVNMPNSNIERAIKRGTGEDKDAAQIVEAYYDAYGPAGTAFYIYALTDNKNRTIASLKAILNKCGGRMGEAGSVAYLFHKKGLITIKAEGSKADELELKAIDAGAEDIVREDAMLEIYTAPTKLAEVKAGLEALGCEIASSQVGFFPQNTVRVENEEDARKILKLMEALEEDEDVSEIYSNFDIPRAVIEKLTNE